MAPRIKPVEDRSHFHCGTFPGRENRIVEIPSRFDFRERYKDFTDDDLVRRKQHFSDEEMVELAVFMALADGFRKVVELLGLGSPDQTCKFEIGEQGAP